MLTSGPPLPPLGGSTGEDDPGDTGIPDLPPDMDDPIDCDADSGCTNQIDLLFVIDNSGTMAEEQLNLAHQFGNLIDRLQNLEIRRQSGRGRRQHDGDDHDMWNPSCAGPWVKPDYEAANGSPIVSACTDRPQRFIDFDGNDLGHVCSQVCSGTATPSDPFIHFDEEATMWSSAHRPRRSRV